MKLNEAISILKRHNFRVLKEDNNSKTHTQGVNETINCRKGFYFGDPCYVMSDKDYNDLHKQMFANKSADQVGKFNINGYEVIVDNTAYGDGFFGGWNAYYSVDSGMMGVVPLELVEKDPTNMGWVCKKAGRVKMETLNDGTFFVNVNGTQVESVDTAADDDDYGETITYDV